MPKSTTTASAPQRYTAGTVAGIGGLDRTIDRYAAIGRSGSAAAESGLALRATFSCPCMIAWIARAEPQPGHNHPVTARNRQGGRRGLADGSSTVSSASVVALTPAMTQVKPETDSDWVTTLRRTPSGLQESRNRRRQDPARCPHASRTTAPRTRLPAPRNASHPCSPGWWRSIHDVPNLSRSIAKRLANGVCAIFMKISPPSARTA